VERVVIVGGGLAAATAAVELRERGFDGELHLVAGEPHNPYERPPLTKGYLLGKDGRNVMFPKPGDWYREHKVTVTVGTRATMVGDHTVRLASGRELPFDRLLLATGAEPRRLDVPGAQAAGIHTFRTVDDSEALKEKLQRGGRRVVFVGAGWIGLELAAAAREYGNSVTVVAPAGVPLAHAIGDELGAMFQELHEQHGVVFRLGPAVTGFSSTDGTVTAVGTDDGPIAADLVVVAIGVQPTTALAEAAGLETDNGILTDEHLLTSRTDIFAAGDVANAYHPVLRARMRNEHWATAIAGGKVAAGSILGRGAVLDDIPYFFTDQYDLGMEYSGYPPLAADARVVYRGNRAAREFIAFWIADSRVVAGMNVNVWDVNEQVQDLIRSGRPVDVDRLTDESVDLAAV
jgi:3-phenylpropionate/trans-cinnamate dioxygenase ferredoxin reductase subunit